MNLKYHIPFLKQVLFYTLTAFGGPQGHFGMLQKTFVEKGKFITQAELLDLFSFCQLLPGASSTQLLGAIAFKRGGLLLSILTILIWITPAALVMILLVLIITNPNNFLIQSNLFRFVKPMTIGFLLYSILKAGQLSLKNKITWIIFFIATIIGSFFFKTPWVFPILILAAGLITNISKKRIPDVTRIKKKHNYRWSILFMFIGIFILSGIVSEQARKHEWQYRKQYNLFENFYRFGSIVFGGGDVLLPMMLDQYVARPSDKKILEKNPNVIKIPKEDLLIGYGMVRALPGPVFSVGAYVGGMALKEEGKQAIILAAVLGTVSLFLPGILLMLFFYPIFQYYKSHVYVSRAMEGIHAVIISLMTSAALFLFFSYTSSFNTNTIIFEIMVMASTFVVLNFTKIPPPLIVLFFLLLGIF